MRFLPVLALLPALLQCARGDEMLLEFEKSRDVNLWQVDDGAPPVQTDRNPLGTGKAMEIPVGTRIHTSMLPRDWSKNAFLEFQYANETRTPVSLLLVIGDMAWLDTRSLWNQYNETFLLAPGKGILRIPLNALPRGQGKQIGLDLKGNLEIDSIVHVEMEFKGSSGRIVMDNLQLTGAGQPTLPAAQTPVPAVDGTPAPAPAAASTKSVCDFENLRDLGMWEQRGEAALVQLSLDHATSGKSAMMLANDTLIITESPPVDWTGFDKLEFDFFLEGQGGGSLEVMIGDAAWLGDQNYWNRHNRVMPLAPGANRVEIPLDGLFRGEPSRRNTRIPRNIDLNAIAAVSLHFTRMQGQGWLDNMRLTRAAGSAGVPPPQTAATPPAPPPAKEWMLFDFENPADLSKWDVRSGAPATQTTEHATRGAKAMSVRPGTLVATYDIPRDWSAFESLEVDIHNTGEGLVKVELLIGDDAWMKKQNYWNRHNAIYTLMPGANTLSIPVSGLYRGEAAARNRDITRNIDALEIVFLSLSFQGDTGAPPLVLDAMRLVRSEGAVPVPGTLPAEAVPAPGTPGAVKVWCGFEQPADFGQWEVRAGPAPKVVASENATQGKSALEAHPGNLLATYAMPRDWSGFASMDFDVFNPGKELVKIEAVVGDEDWTRKQNYWNRHNAVFTVPPGHSTLSLPVQGMYRGEAASRNRDILRNIEPNAIVFFSLTLQGAAGQAAVLLDNFRLTPAGEPAPNPAALGPLRVRGFDFGPADQQIWPGFESVQWNTVYDKGRGFGLERAQARDSHAADTLFPTRLLGDYVWVEKGDFLVDLPRGEYEVLVWFEDSGYWSDEHPKHLRRGMYAEGVEKRLEDRSARGPHDDALHLLQDIEPAPGQDVLKQYFQRLYSPRRFTTSVSDGQLNLGFFSDARFSTRVAAVVVLPSGHPGVEAWVADLMEKNLRELRTKAAGFPLPAPRYDGLPESARTGAALVFLPRLDETVGMTHVPAADRLGGTMRVRIARGETGPMTFAVHPLHDLGNAVVTTEMAAGGPALEVRAVRHMAKRGYGDSSFRILPWWLADCPSIALPAGVTRQFWVNVSVAEEAPAGTYAGAVLLTIPGGDPIRMPFEVEVLPFQLEKPDFSFTFFGMPSGSVPVFAQYGVTCLNGGPSIQFKGFQPNGEAAFDFTATDAFFAEGARHGLVRLVLDYAGPVSIAGVDFRNMENFFRGEGVKLGISGDEAARRVFEVIRARGERLGWPPLSLNLVDEPLSRELSSQSLAAAQFVKRVAPWLKTCGYYSFNPVGDPLGNDRLFQALDVTITKGYDAATMEAARKAGRTICLYSLGKNRFVFGPLMYRHARNGVAGYVQWHSSIIHGYQFFDLDGREPDEGVIMLTREGARPTLDLERCRAGINDFRYLQTLAHRAGAAGPGGASALRRLDELLSAVPMDAREAPARLDLDAMRREVADLIRDLPSPGK